ncbi:MAG: DUF1329 domain-containing protein, partial [Bradyrhizobium sp.]
MRRLAFGVTASIAAMLASGAALAGVSAAEAGKLGKELTEVGAERAGNAAGTIPAYVGKASFDPAMLKITRAQLEELRVRLVKDIQAMIGDAAVVGDILQQGQQIIDAEPAKADQIIAIVQQMLGGDADLKAEFDRTLKARGKSVDGLLAQVKARQIKLPAMKDDIVAVIQSLKGKPDWMTRLVQAFDIGHVLDILAIVDDPKTRVQANELLMKYTPSYVKGFLQYNIPGKTAEPLASMRPLYVITKANVAQYDKLLTEGHKAMFKTYPDYKMIVFPSYRNAFFPDDILKATIANASRATLVGTDDVQGAELGFPFPIPKSGAEPLWNHKLKFRGSAVKRFNNQAIVKPDGSYKISKLVEDVKFKYANLK